MMIKDISGDVAVFEYVDGGKPTIYHGIEYAVMTKSPTFDKQLENLKQYQG
jgi:penicillin V acylase-like amidase (Ntn superfamily)